MLEAIIVKLCSLVVDGIELVSENTEMIGVSSEDLIRLKFQGVLKENKGVYSFVNAGYIYNYGKTLLNERRVDKALKAFRKCLEINPNHVGANYCLFYECIKNRYFDEALKHLIILFETSDERYSNDYNFYLFLLSNITKLPQDYELYVRYLRFDDVKKSIYDVNKEEEINLINEMRKLVMARKFNDATKVFLNNQRLGKKATIDNILLNQMVYIQSNLMNKLKEYLYAKDYKSVISTLEEIKNIRKLGKGEKYTLLLSKTLLRIKRFGFVPEPRITLTQNVFEAIDGENYSLALTLAQKANIRDNFFEIILSDIVKEINSNKSKSYNSSLINKRQYELLTMIHNHNTDGFLIELNDFLRFINKSAFYPLFETLVEIETIEPDSVFDIIADSIININRVGFIMDTDIYLHNFYLALHESKIKTAGLYFNAINILHELNRIDVDIESLREMYNKYYNKAIELDPSIEEDEFTILCRKINAEPVPESDTKQSKEAKYITRKLNKHVAYLLSERTDAEEESLYSEISNKNSIRRFKIGNSKTVFLKQNIDNIDNNALLKAAYNAIDNKKYDEAINCLNTIISSYYANSKNLGRYFNILASIYFEIKDYKTAYDYYLIADGIFKSLNLPSECSDMIKELESILEIDSKSEPLVLESEFAFDLDPEIAKYIDTARLLFESIDNLDEECQNYGLNKEESLIVYLILARDCYKNNNRELGESLLDKVSNSADKSSKVNYLLRVLKDESNIPKKSKAKSLVF